MKQCMKQIESKKCMLGIAEDAHLRPVCAISHPVVMTSAKHIEIKRSYLFANPDLFCHTIGPCQNSPRLAWMISRIIGSIKTPLEQSRKNERNCLHPPFSLMSSSFSPNASAFWLAHPCSLLHMDSGISEGNVFPSAIGLSICKRQRHCVYGPYRYH